MLTFSDPTWVRKDVTICLLLTRRNPNYVSDEKGDSIKRSSQPQSFALAFRGLGAEPTNKLLQKLLTLHCLLLCSGALFVRVWNRVPEKKKFHFVKTFGPESPVKLSFQEIRQTQKCHQSLTPQRFPEFSKRENDFEGYVIWC